MQYGAPAFPKDTLSECGLHMHLLFSVSQSKKDNLKRQSLQWTLNSEKPACNTNPKGRSMQKQAASVCGCIMCASLLALWKHRNTPVLDVPHSCCWPAHDADQDQIVSVERDLMEDMSCPNAKDGFAANPRHNPCRGGF